MAIMMVPMMIVHTIWEELKVRGQQAAGAQLHRHDATRRRKTPLHIKTTCV